MPICPSLLWRKTTKTRGWCGFTGIVYQNKLTVRVLSVSLFFCCYSQVKCLRISCQPKAGALLQNCNAVTLKCEKGIKTCYDKIFLPQSICPFLLYLYLLLTPLWLAMTGQAIKAKALPSRYQEKHGVCTFVCHLTDQWFSMKTKHE